MEGVDYSTGRPNLDTLWGQGIRFVCRYLAYVPNAKVLSKSELVNLHNRGLEVVLNWEQASGDMLRGYDVGKVHAQEALRQANVLGCPSDIPIYFSCDVDTTDGQRDLVARYLDGAASVLGLPRVGVYGEFDVIKAMVPTHATWGWQTYAWSSGRISNKAHLYQYKNGVTIGGADCDRNRTLQLNFGSWEKGHTVAITQQEIDAIASAAARAVWTRPLAQGTTGYVGQQAETALAFAWQMAKEANDGVGALTTTCAQILARFDGINPSDITDADRTSINDLADAVNALNNRLATP